MASLKVKSEADAIFVMQAINKHPKNFTKEETYVLCKSWGKSSLDNIEGADKKGERFWKQVKEYYDAMYEKEASVMVLDGE